MLKGAALSPDRSGNPFL